jgi:hypothetical protein
VAVCVCVCVCGCVGGRELASYAGSRSEGLVRVRASAICYPCTVQVQAAAVVSSKYVRQSSWPNL